MFTTGEQGLPRTSPEAQGIASAAILRFVEALESQIHEIHSVMLLRHGSVVAEGWWSPYGRDYPHMLFSLSKSFTSTAVGLALSEGHFSMDDPVVSFFPEETPAEVSDLLAALRVRHLLTMSTGQASDTWASMMEQPDGNWIRGFFEIPVVNAPGSPFVYNNGATYMLSAIVQRTTGMKVVDYLQARLFAPLGIEKAAWQESPQGITAGGIGLSLKTEDAAKFGQLYLQKGVWQGQQLLPEGWAEEATRLQIANGPGIQIDWAQGYGYQFWRGRHKTYRGDGVFGQWCIVMPEQEAVLAITSGLDIFDSQEPLNLVWELLLPAFSPGAIPEDSAAHEALAAKLSSLSFAPVQGKQSAPIAAEVSGQTYVVDDNALNLETIALNFTEAGCIVSIKTAAGEETIRCGYGAWQRDQTTTLFRQPLVFERTPVAVSGAWTADETFTMICRLYETPFFHTLDCHFVGDELMIETRINVSLESTKPLLLTAHSLTEVPSAEC
ncbi:MAG: serine hydrolase [Chloroflexi bacterium]|nr:serine hydrolase [Chloroflexota bacterium]